MNALVNRFLDYVNLERGLSPNTAKAYESDLRAFVSFLEERRVTSVNNVRRKDVLEYLVAEKERGLRVNSLSRRLVTIKVFFKFLQQEGLLGVNITEAMESPRLWRILPTVLSQNEVQALLDVPTGEEPTAIRDRAILDLLYSSGLRVSELTELQLNDLHIDEGYVRCLGKGSKVRVVPFGAKAKERLRDYLTRSRGELAKGARRSATPVAGHVFLTYRGRKFSRKGIWKLIKTYARICGIKKTVSPHTMRHSFASHLLANGAPLRVIQEMLGHADIGTTQMYTHVDQNRLRSVHAKYHPRA